MMGSVTNETLLFIYEAAKNPINEFEYGKKKSFTK